MTKVKLTVIALMSMFCVAVFADIAAATTTPAAPAADCSTMGPDMQQFAAQLSGPNKMMFCGQFTDPQRAQAMQMMGQPDESGNVMTADQAVQKVAGGNKMTPNQKTPTGCPVK